MEINQANRQCCDLDIREFATNKPFLFADFCNTTTAGFSSDPVYAMKKGAKCIKFDNPLDATMSMTFQVHPFKIYALLADGTIKTDAVITKREDLVAATGGTLTLTETPVAGSVFVYAKGDIGGTAIEGTVENKIFTPTTSSAVTVGSTYSVAYITSLTNSVQRISFNNKSQAKNYRITQETLDKDEDGNMIPVKMVAYKACPQRNMEWSWSSEGDAAELTITFDVLTTSEGDVLDMIQIVDED